MEQRKNPTYEDVCRGNTGHAETVMIEYDDSMIKLDKLLTEFFKTINPTTKNRQGNDIGSQFIENKQREYSRPIVTEVLPLLCYYPAEEYHQNYLDKNPGGYCHVDLNLIQKDDKIRN